MQAILNEIKSVATFEDVEVVEGFDKHGQKSLIPALSISTIPSSFLSSTALYIIKFILTHWISVQDAVFLVILPLCGVRIVVGYVLNQVYQCHMAVVWSADEVLDPGVVGVGPEVNLQVSEDDGERLEVEEESLLGTFLLEFWLGVTYQLLNVEDASQSCLDLILQ